MADPEDKKAVSNYIASQSKWSEGLTTLRKICNQTKLEETVKWGLPSYTLDGKIIASIAGFNNHFTIWFHQGVFLKDQRAILVNAQDGKTKGMRQWRFENCKEIDTAGVLEYLEEAIVNQKAGKQIERLSKPKLDIPAELAKALQQNKKLATNFFALSPGKQREFAEHIASAKQEITRLSRLEKAKPLILAGVGLNDKYKRG